MFGLPTHNCDSRRRNTMVMYKLETTAITTKYAKTSKRKKLRNF
jgi:hypothetical protein